MSVDKSEGVTSSCVMSEFEKMQFSALREEISGIKERVIRIQIAGVTGIPLIISVGEKFDLSAILTGAPIICVAFILILIFEQNSLMRAGAFIKLHIEEKQEGQGVRGWEHWLQADPARRHAERFFAWSAVITFSLYFIVATYLAIAAIFDRFGPEFGYGATGVYCGLFVLAVPFVAASMAIDANRFRRSSHVKQQK